MSDKPIPCPFCRVKPLSCAEGIKHRRTTKNLWCPLGENEDAIYDLVDWQNRPEEDALREALQKLYDAQIAPEVYDAAMVTARRLLPQPTN